MRRDFFLYQLTPTEFEKLVVSICKSWFGEGTTGFADGPDGGRDAKFNGKAQKYPSTSGPWDGQVVIQAKHTAKPDASCSDADFKKYFFPKKDGTLPDGSEVPKIIKLIEEDILNFYIVFTNRKLTANKEKVLVKELKKLGITDVAIIGLEALNQYLQENPVVARNLPSNVYYKPFDFSPDEMVEVITEVHSAINTEESEFKSEIDFTVVNKKRVKNKINKMSDSYYQTVVVNGYMALFPRLKSFLENERNRDYRDTYHDIANELRQKIILFRDEFDAFEEILVYLYDEINLRSPDLKGKRRYVTFLLCYMYFDCDIGEREPEEI